MKKTNRNRMVAPVSASFALLLALSACSSSGVNQGGGTNNSGSSESASTSTEDGRQIVGLGDDNKAGKPRPRSERETRGDRHQVKSDGSWTEKTSSGQEKTTVNADGTWESFDAQRNERVHVNPDGSWIRVRESGDTDLTKGAKGMEVKADGTWRSVDSYSTLYGTADGKVYQEKPGQEKREVGKELTPSTVPVNPIAYAEGGVGGNSVVPLKPRTPLKPGEKAQ